MSKRQRLPQKPLRFGSGVNEYDLHDHRREQDFRSIGGNFTNFYRSASSVDSVSEEIYSRQAFYMPILTAGELIAALNNMPGNPGAG